MALKGSVRSREVRAAELRSKTGLNRRRHAAEKASRQAFMVPQNEGDANEFPDDVHDRDITIRRICRNESWNP
jgi:hypothetical protein